MLYFAIFCCEDVAPKSSRYFPLKWYGQKVEKKHTWFKVPKPSTFQMIGFQLDDSKSMKNECFTARISGTQNGGSQSYHKAILGVSISRIHIAKKNHGEDSSSLGTFPKCLVNNCLGYQRSKYIWSHQRSTQIRENLSDLRTRMLARGK